MRSILGCLCLTLSAGCYAEITTGYAPFVTQKVGSWDPTGGDDEVGPVPALEEESSAWTFGVSCGFYVDVPWTPVSVGGAWYAGNALVTPSDSAGGRHTASGYELRGDVDVWTPSMLRVPWAKPRLTGGYGKVNGLRTRHPGSEDYETHEGGDGHSWFAGLTVAPRHHMIQLTGAVTHMSFHGTAGPPHVPMPDVQVSAWGAQVRVLLTWIPSPMKHYRYEGWQPLPDSGPTYEAPSHDKVLNPNCTDHCF